MTTERTRMLARQVMGAMRREYGRHTPATRKSGLEELLLGVLSAGGSERKASAALRACSDSFVDWNEMRVSADGDIMAVLGDLPEADRKASVVRTVLERVYEVNNEMSLDYLKERPVRDAVRLVGGIPGFPEAALARAFILALGRKELPLTHGVTRVCRRLAMIADGPVQDSKLEKALPPRALFEFHWLLSRHAETVCHEAQPKCDICCLRKDCKAALVKSATHGSKSSSTGKKRKS